MAHSTSRPSISGRLRSSTTRSKFSAAVTALAERRHGLRRRRWPVPRKMADSPSASAILSSTSRMRTDVPLIFAGDYRAALAMSRVEPMCRRGKIVRGGT